MIIENGINFGVINWEEVPTERHEGTNRYAIWKIKQFGAIIVRIVEYSKNYLADYWCNKGHIIFCMERRRNDY
jgi:hypothetical protein